MKLMTLLTGPWSLQSMEH